MKILFALVALALALAGCSTLAAPISNNQDVWVNKATYFIFPWWLIDVNVYYCRANPSGTSSAPNCMQPNYYSPPENPALTR